MAKNKNTRKKNSVNQNGGYKKYLRDLQMTLDLLGLSVNISALPPRYKRVFYERRVKMTNPKAENEHVTPKQVNEIGEKMKHIYRNDLMDFDGVQISTHHISLFIAFFINRNNLNGNSNREKQIEMLQNLLFCFYMITLKLVTQFGNPCSKYFKLGIQLDTSNQGGPMQFHMEIGGVLNEKIQLMVDGVKRPAFRLGRPSTEALNEFEWVSVRKKVLKGHYNGKMKELDVYIQSHTLQRLNERLDVLDQSALNYLLWENTHEFDDIIEYKGNLLLPVLVYDVRVGYFLLTVVSDCVLISTFLFITHKNTPEGDKLSELTGLGKYDISFWKIDVLSTILAHENDDSNLLMDLLEKSGIKNFGSLKEKKFDIESLQLNNNKGLLDFLHKNQQLQKVMLMR